MVLALIVYYSVVFSNADRVRTRKKITDHATTVSYHNGLRQLPLQKLANIAHDWLVAGADIVSTATYQVTEEGLKKRTGSTEAASDAVNASVKSIHETCAEFWKQYWQQRGEDKRKKRKTEEGGETEPNVNRRYPKVALTMGPLIATFSDGSEYTPKYDDSVTPDTLYDFHLSRTLFLYNACGETPADILAFETIGCVAEAEAISRAMSAPKTRNLPYWVGLQCRDDGHLASGEDMESAILGILRESITHNVVAIGVNCVDIVNINSLVESVQKTINSFFAHANADQHRSVGPVHVVAYPNSGEQFVDKVWCWPTSKQLTPSGWAAAVHHTRARIVGGCCRIGLAHIRALHDKVSLSGNF